MIPPDALKLPEPFKNTLQKKDESEKKKEWSMMQSFIFWLISYIIV